MASSRGRPRSFCTDTALDKAMAVFWTHGFQGASMAELTAAMGLNKPSLYAAYGDKEALYLKVLARYAEQYVKTCLAKLDAEADIKQAVGAYLRSVVDMQTNPELPGGCLILKSAGECSSTSSQALNDARQVVMQLNRTKLHERLVQAQTAGQLAASTNIDDLVDLFLTMASGFAIMAQTGSKYEQLETVIETVLKMWPVTALKPTSIAPEVRLPPCKVSNKKPVSNK